MEWEQVFRRHRSFKAVAKSGGRATSVLAGNLAHSDARKPNGILLYTVPNSPGYSWMRAALEEAHRKESSVVVFMKRSSNDWEDLGPHVVGRVSAGEYETTYEFGPVAKP